MTLKDLLHIVEENDLEQIEKDFSERLKAKGYTCGCECKIHQIKNLGIKEEIIPNLKEKHRIGVIKRLSVSEKEIENKKEKIIEKIELDKVILEKYTRWYQSEGKWGEIVVILEQSEQKIYDAKDLETNPEIIKFVPTSSKDRRLNDYGRKVILMGIKSLFDLKEIDCWDKIVYFLYYVSSTGKSAGIALLLAFYSSYYKIGIPDDVAITGELNTGDGSIKGIGGLKEKVILSACSKSIKTLIVPHEDYQDALDILNEHYTKKDLNIYSVSHWKNLVDWIKQYRIN